ncbi:sulfurtransferase TusA family protein [Limoniibacter endophyticus]|uniref:sulfurtransferase TusA family protein n=1 Tax=Limoniibacter endophyticus TaxID=1565040 RepID=UPI001672846D|nr:sulfurtransferase TusA family protein [Limoniibacter endophyticus]
MSNSPALPEIYDLRGLNCPLPVLKARKRLAAMQTGERLAVATTDPLAVIDLAALCNDDGHVLVETIPDKHGHVFVIQKG